MVEDAIKRGIEIISITFSLALFFLCDIVAAYEKKGTKRSE